MTVYYLSHSGVPGQRAGERNGPPYPLPAATRARLAARAAKDSKKTDNKSKTLVKAKSTLSGIRDFAKNKYDAYKNIRNANKPKNVKTMSDSELREWLNRYDMEQRYIKATSKKNSSVIDTGKKLIGDTLLTFGKTALTNLATNYANDLTKPKPVNSHSLLIGDASKMSDDELKRANIRRSAENLHNENKRKAQEAEIRRKEEEEIRRKDEERYKAWLYSRRMLHHSSVIPVFRTLHN